MSDQAITIEPAAAPPPRAWAAPNERGQWPEDALDRKYAPGNLGALLLIEQPEGWRAGWEATLPEAVELDLPTVQQAAQSRELATVAALERLISWCGEQKARGRRKHREAAEQLQEWALSLSRRAAFAEQLQEQTPPAAQPGGTEREISGDPRRGSVPLQALANDGEIRLIPIEQLHESPWNPRQIYPEGEMAELVESMRSSGFRAWLPLLVRPRTIRPDGESAGEEYGYEIGAGHRRRRAAELAGIREIPCIVRQLSDAEFLDVLNFDNSGREDVHPLHEAAGWRTWMERTGKGVVDIAARVGQSKEYVYQRLKYAALIPEAQKLFLENPKFTSVHAILVARQQPAVQAKALKRIFWRGDGVAISTRELADWLHGEAYQDLRGCAFDRADRALLASAGSCEDCPKRAANIPGFEFEKEDPNADLCTDKKCYQQKLDNHLFRVRTDLLPETGNMGLMVSEEWATKKKGAHVRGTWERVKKGDKGAQPAVVVEGPNVGKVVHVKLIQREEREIESRRDTQARARAEEERRTKLEQEVKIRRAILEAVRSRIGGLQRGDIEALLVRHFGGFDEDCALICDLHGIKFEGYRAPRALEEALPKLKEHELFQLVVEAAVIEELGDWRTDEEPKALLALAKRYKVDTAKIRRDLEEAAKAAAGDTRREVTPADTGEGKPAKQKPAKKAAPAKKPAAKKAPAKKKGLLTPEMRKRIAAAQKKRWLAFRAEQRKALGKGGK